MYPEILYSNTFTLLAEAEVGKHFYWNIGGAPYARALFDFSVEKNLMN